MSKQKMKLSPVDFDNVDCRGYLVKLDSISKSWKKRFMDGFRATVAFVFSKVGICVLVIGYLFVGAAMFQQLEGRVMTNVHGFRVY